MSQIALVSNQHNDNIRISMVPQLLKPSGNVLVGLVFANVVDQQSSNGASVVCGSDGTVSLLASSIPNLCFDRLRIYLDRPSSELYTNRRLRVQVELVPRESTQQVGFTNTRVSDQDN